MKPTPAKEAARRTAEAKAIMAAKATEKAEANRNAIKEQKSRAALERKLSCALLMAAAEGASNLTWKGDLSVVPILIKRGIWVYEKGLFSESEVVKRLKEWRSESLYAVIQRWIAHPHSKVHLTDKKALSKLFGGSIGFAKLHVPTWEIFFDRIGDENDFWVLRESNSDPYMLEDLLISCFDKAWQQAVRCGEIESVVSLKSIQEYGQIYSGEMLRQLRDEAFRSTKKLDNFLAADRHVTSHIAADESIIFEDLSELKFDYIDCVVDHLAGDWPALVTVENILGREGAQDFKGRILHPAIFGLYGKSRKSEGDFSTLDGVDSLELFWMPVQRDWLPFDDTVDVQTLSWLGARDGKRFCRCVFGLVDSAAQEGHTQVELLLTQLSSCWTLAGDDDLSHYSLPPTLLSLMLSGYGYKVKSSSSGKKHRLVITW